jgi:hypothetical protein
MKQTSTAGACAPLQPRLRLVGEAHRGIREKNDAGGTAGVQSMDTPSGRAQPWGTQGDKKGNDGFKEKVLCKGVPNCRDAFAMRLLQKPGLKRNRATCSAVQGRPKKHVDDPANVRLRNMDSRC